MSRYRKAKETTLLLLNGIKSLPEINFRWTQSLMAFASVSVRLAMNNAFIVQFLPSTVSISSSLR